MDQSLVVQVAPPTVTVISLDGVEYEIDLSAEHTDELHAGAR
jgi:hypothetical protein